MIMSINKNNLLTSSKTWFKMVQNRKNTVTEKYKLHREENIRKSAI